MSSHFPTRDADFAETGQDGDPSRWVPSAGSSPSKSGGRASPQHSGRSGASGSATVHSQAPPLPALPADLLDALAREPPSPPREGSGGSNSLSMSRGGSAPATATAGLLPSVPPVSPLGLPYPGDPASSPHSLHSTFQAAAGAGEAPYAAPMGFSTNRTAAASSSYSSSLASGYASAPPGSPSHARNPRADPFFSSSSTRPYPAPSPSLPASPPPSSRRNMFKSLGFGRSRASLPPRAAAGSIAPVPRTAPPGLAPSPPEPASVAPFDGTAPGPRRVVATWGKATLYGSPAPSPSANLAESNTSGSAPPSPVVVGQALTLDHGAAARVSTFAVEDGAFDDVGHGDGDASLIAGGPVSSGVGRWRGGGEQYTRDLEREHSSGDEEAAEDETAAFEVEVDGEGAAGAQAEQGRPALPPPVPHVVQLANADVGTAGEGLRRLELGTSEGSPLGGEDSPESPTPTADFVVAVVGPRNVGKSTVIRRGLKRPAEKPVVLKEDEQGNRVTVSTTSFTLGAQRRTIEVLEIDMHLLKYSEEGVIWPDGLPQCEGAMLCYDSTDPGALHSLSVLLQAFWTRGSDVPLIVLACKATSAGEDAVNPKAASAVCNVYGAGIVQLDGGLEDPEKKAKLSFNFLIRQIMKNREPELERPPSSASNHSPVESRRGSLRNSASYASTTRSSVTSAGPSSPALSSAGLARRSSLGAGLGLSVVQEAPVGVVSPEPSDAAAEQAAIEAEADAAIRAALAAGAESASEGEGEGEMPLSPASAVTVIRSEDTTSTAASTDGSRGSAQGRELLKGGVVLPQPQTAERRGSKTAALDLYFQRDDMIDKFLFAAVAGNDETFVTLFLITYRRFARPYDVVEKLIERFEFVASRHKTDPLLSRYGQMKLCGVLTTWMQTYPGDFTAPTTFGILQPFLESLLPRGATWVAHYAFELVPLLSPISAMSDPESSWALPDKPLEETSFAVPDALPAPTHALPRPPSPIRRPSFAPSYDSSGSLAPSSRFENEMSKTTSRLSVPTSIDTLDTSPHLGASTTSLHAASEAGTLDTHDSQSQTGTGGVEGVGSLGGSSAGSSLLRAPQPRFRHSAVLVDTSNAVLELREEDVATQITRMAWEMFGGMLPRDLIRHVLAPRDPANPRVALRDSESNVMRSIAFVNYLAQWTATLILVQSRPKRRARMVEKMLLIAAALREQENFDSLMGVLAGLNSQPVFRLTETMDLVTTKLDGDPRQQPQRTEQPDGSSIRLPKKLRSLNRLMAATKSFAAYRLALENSSINVIPYLGVHLQDITAVNEVKSDLRDGKVNWSKFQQMGKSAAIVLDCARQPPPLPVDRTIERYVMHVPALSEDEQYALSYAHQPRAGERTGTRARLKGLAKATFAGAV
ncbi:hypothetical protein JCM10207_002371 [Rhodosporidiobolus poonsookiae]